MKENHEIGARWLMSLTTERRISNATLQLRADGLGCFLDWLESRQLGLASVTSEDVVDYISHLGLSGLQPPDVRHRRIVVRALHRFTRGWKLAGVDPTTALTEQDRAGDTSPDVRREEAEAVIDTAHELADRPDFNPYERALHARRAAFLETVCSTDVPIGDVVRFPKEMLRPVTLTEPVLRRTSGGDAFPSERAMESIRRWHRLAASWGSISERWVFHAIGDGKRPLTRQGAYIDVRAAAAAAGLSHPERITPLTMRGAMAARDRELTDQS